MRQHCIDSVLKVYVMRQHCKDGVSIVYVIGQRCIDGVLIVYVMRHGVLKCIRHETAFYGWSINSICHKTALHR